MNGEKRTKLERGGREDRRENEKKEGKGTDKRTRMTQNKNKYEEVRGRGK